MRNRDDKLFRIGNRVAVAVFVAELDDDGHACDGFDPLLGHECGVIAGARGQDQQRIQLAENVGRAITEQSGVNAFCEHRFHGVGQGTRLLVNLFLHEVLIGAKFACVIGDIAYVYAALDWSAGAVHYLYLRACEFRNITFFQIHYPPRFGNDGGHVGGDKVFAVAFATDANQ